MLIKETLSPNENSRTRLTIYHEDLETPIGFPFMKRDDITPEMIMARFLLVSQSNKDLKIENDLIISASTLDIISGGSNRLEEFVLRKDCIIKVKNIDNLCALRCIVIGIAHNNFLENPNLKNEYDNIIKSNKNKQTRETYILADALSINVNHKCSIVEIKKAEEYLEIYQLLVISGEDFDFVYVGPPKDKKIVLFHHKDHFDYIKSLPAFFNKHNFCFLCLHTYHNDFFHACVKICKVCKQKNCVQKPDKSFKCDKCKLLCSDKDCLLKHQENVCEDYSKCTTCGRIQLSRHVCEGRWCINCKSPVEMNHKCFILTEDERNQSKRKRKMATKLQKPNQKKLKDIFFSTMTLTVIILVNVKQWGICSKFVTNAQDL